MGRNEIRLRRQIISSGRIARHRNYHALMAAHEREQRLRRIVRVVIYFLLILFLVVVFLMVSRWQDQPAPANDPPAKTSFAAGDSSRQ